MKAMTLGVAEALLWHSVIRREEIPPIAIDLLEAGTDTPTIRKLAGLTDAELAEAHDLFRKVLVELGRTPPTRGDAARTIAKYLAELTLVEGANLREVAARGARLAPAFDYHSALIPFLQADDEYDVPGIWKRRDIDRELKDYARKVLGGDSGHAV